MTPKKTSSSHGRVNSYYTDNRDISTVLAKRIKLKGQRSNRSSTMSTTQKSVEPSTKSISHHKTKITVTQRETSIS